MKSIEIHPASLFIGAALLLLLGAQNPMAQPFPSDRHKLPLLSLEEKEILSHFSIVELDDGVGGLCKTIRVSGVNVQVVNGTGSTDTLNCLGNLIVGYNETRGPGADHRSGSHNVVIGKRHNYSASAVGGLLVGDENTLEGAFASVSGGTRNKVSGNSGAISGGAGNQVILSVFAASVSGGFDNNGSADYSSILGGSTNTTSGERSAIAGGAQNVASGEASTVGGGNGNLAEGQLSAVSGGLNNQALHADSTVSGGGFVHTSCNQDHKDHSGCP